MRIYNYFAVLLLSAALLFSCSKSEGIEEPVNPQEPETPTAKLPNITFGKPATKALLDDDSLKTEGSKIKVYDLLTNYSGTTIVGWDPDDPYYIDEEIVYNNTEVWKYANNGIYPWTANGIHKFFGYLTFDKRSNLKVSDLFASGELSISEDTVLTVPSITFTHSTKQFDFLYSDLVKRDAADKNYTVVPLKFNHLFTALSVELQSLIDAEVRVGKITFEGLKNTNDATITFTNESLVSYGNLSYTDISFFPTITDSIHLTKNQTYDVLTQEMNPEKRSFRMLWPQSAQDVSPTTGQSSDSLVVVKYALKVNGEWEEHSSRMRLPNFSWDAGKKVHFTIQFTDKRIALKTVVIPWDYNEYDVDYSEGTVVVPKGLKFDAGTCSIQGKNIIVRSGQNPKGSFNIVAPVGGTWMVGMTGDTEYFSVSPTSDLIDPHGEDAGKVTLTITPNRDLSRPRDMKIQLKFTVVANGREIDAQDEINRDNWTIILPQ